MMIIMEEKNIETDIEKSIRDKHIIIARKILEKFKCDMCGKCCNIPVNIFSEDIEKLSKFLNITIDDFRNKYMINQYYLRMPCPFNKDKKCIVYPVRPDVCTIYPFNSDIPKIDGMKECGLADKIYRFIKNHRKDIVRISHEYENKELIDHYRKMEDLLKKYNFKIGHIIDSPDNSHIDINRIVQKQIFKYNKILILSLPMEDAILELINK